MREEVAQEERAKVQAVINSQAERITLLERTADRLREEANRLAADASDYEADHLVGQGKASTT